MELAKDAGAEVKKLSHFDEYGIRDKGNSLTFNYSQILTGSDYQVCSNDDLSLTFDRFTQMSDSGRLGPFFVLIKLFFIK